MRNISKIKEDFINKSLLIHNKKYDYSLVNYINTKTRVKIICPIHGIFEQTPEKHYTCRRGCLKCGYEKMSLSKCKKIFQYDLQQQLITEFNSTKEAAKILNINEVDISACLNRRQKTSGGYIWSFTELEPLDNPIETQKPNGFFTNLKYYNEAIQYAKECTLKCKTRVEFHTKYRNVYKFASKNGIIDEICSHMLDTRVIKDRILYCILFEKESKTYFYIGLSHNFNERINSHLKRSSNKHIKQFIKNENIKPTKIIKLTKYINEDDACLLEDVFINFFKEQGLICLNIAKAGAKGGSKPKYTEQELLDIALKYKTKVDWVNNDKGTNMIARKRGKEFYDKCCAHMTQLQKPHHYWKDFNNLKSHILELTNELNHFPTTKELEKLKRFDILGAIFQHHGGIKEVKSKLTCHIQ